MNRNLVVCCDGTWNVPTHRSNGVLTPTNVLLLHNVAEKSDTQLKYYHPGVGTEGGIWDKVTGGITGKGLERNIMSAYKWLGMNYEDGDKIFLFGFSRGAYTVRSLAGMITKCGLLDLKMIKDQDEIWKRIENVYRRYRSKTYKCVNIISEIRIHFIGVWDTVGALGIPEELPFLRKLLCKPAKYSFHDLKLSDNINNARHAVALDETRVSYIPTLWNTKRSNRRVKQVWFPGVHSDVGGGYLEKGLSDGALEWMINEAVEQGLQIKHKLYKQIMLRYTDVLHDSYSGIFKFLKFRTEPRTIPQLKDGSDEIHPSALKRKKRPSINDYPAYHYQAEVNGEQSEPIPIYAREYWNPTGIYLKKGTTYEFKASGQWIDWYVKFGPEGMVGEKYRIRRALYFLGSLIGKFEKVIKKRMSLDRLDFWWTKRFEETPWMSLVGVVANGESLTADGIYSQHEVFLIGKGKMHIPRRSGYLYCFANNSWYFQRYGKGEISLKIKRLC